MVRTASIVLSAWVWLCCAALPSAADVLHHWVQLGPDGNIVIRATSTSPDCPLLQIDGRPVAMTLRAPPDDLFPEIVCEHRTRKSPQQITLDGATLPTLSTDVQRIAVIGDTGCRIRRGRVQACNDPAAWPLKTIAADIATRSPDLVIHVGDYLYRAAECPDAEKCGGSAFGDTFPTWSVDWLDPAERLFQSAPFVFLRGNHESCQRSNKGWFRYFASGPVPSVCPAVTDPWIASVNGLDLISFDSAAGPAAESNPALLNVYAQMARDMFAKTSGETWLLTHRPLWVKMRAFGELIDGDDTQRAAFAQAIPDRVNLILSGHIHAFQAIDLRDGPVQGISGNGGTQLDPMPTGVTTDVEIAGRLASVVANNGDFGFLMLTRQANGGWSMEAIDATGNVRNRCRLTGRTLSC